MRGHAGMLVLALLAPAMATSARHRPGHELHLLANASLPLHVVSVSTTEQINAEQLDGLRESCSARFPDITFLGRNQTYFAGHTSKAMWLIQHLKTLPPEQVVLYLDTDLRCFPCGRDVLQEFLAQKAEIVVASDYDGHPDFWKEDWFPEVPTGLPPKARRYINSGTVMGRAKHLQALLVRYMLIHAQHLQLKEFHDQRLFQDAFLAQYYSPEPTGDPTIAIDYEGRIAQTFDNRDAGWEQLLPSKQVRNPQIYRVDACILHTAGEKRWFYDGVVPRWRANETNLHPNPVVKG